VAFTLPPVPPDTPPVCGVEIPAVEAGQGIVPAFFATWLLERGAASAKGLTRLATRSDARVGRTSGAAVVVAIGEEANILFSNQSPY